ncbi:DUF4902 domain-containing protein [Variovorax sp. dw_954]|uniref:DUF4902 domain-containing protein n=1 Tax=Variovorax sp. dw_954 TaxID=2720078 RepID=UPI001BD25BE8|nr:DUF4902 domain-containing protein [Variovorax sp. dw_954]
MSTFTTDGLLRLRPQDLGRMTLTHLISGIDEAEEGAATTRCGAGTSLSGYTEWVSAQEPGLTLGWDWQLETRQASLQVVRQGLPRTNVLVVRAEHDPLPWDESLEVLANFIDTFDWNTQAFDAVCQRYSV